jgi:hypothetical protein
VGGSGPLVLLGCNGQGCWQRQKTAAGELGACVATLMCVKNV